MDDLIKKIKIFSIEEAKKIEEIDRQFLSIKKLHKKIPDNYYCSLVISNALIGYQLSGTGEDYWEEFSNFILNYDFKNRLDIIKFFDDFLQVCSCNKRLVNMKKIRLQKIKTFLEIFTGKENFFYNNMTDLQEVLSKSMKQKKTDKTIVFAIKMFGYAGRNIWGFSQFPYNISIPIDSRLKNLYKKYNKNQKISIEDFYITLCEKTNIPPLHLDSLLWVNYDKLIKDDEK